MNGLRYPFSPQQREILRLLALGNEAPEIARAIGTTIGTVHFQRNCMREVLACTSAELIVFAVRWSDARKDARKE